jgi:hypothetical protein
MDTDKNNLKNRLIDEIVKDIFSSTEPSEHEDAQLWAYALDIFDPLEQEQVMNLIVKSEQSQKELARIREAISAATVLERARIEAKSLLAAMGQKLTSFAAVVVATKQGLLMAYRNYEEYGFGLPLVPVMAGRDIEQEKDISKQQDSLEMCSPYHEIKSREGVKVSITQIPERGFDIHVEITKPPFEGWIELVRIIVDNGVAREEDTGIKVRLIDKKARLVDCPTGALKIIASGNRSVPFLIL